jgi:hypothetical protein
MFGIPSRGYYWAFGCDVCKGKLQEDCPYCSLVGAELKEKLRDALKEFFKARKGKRDSKCVQEDDNTGLGISL